MDNYDKDNSIRLTKSIFPVQIYISKYLYDYINKNNIFMFSYKFELNKIIIYFGLGDNLYYNLTFDDKTNNIVIKNINIFGNLVVLYDTINSKNKYKIYYEPININE